MQVSEVLISGLLQEISYRKRLKELKVNLAQLVFLKLDRPRSKIAESEIFLFS